MNSSIATQSGGFPQISKLDQDYYTWSHNELLMLRYMLENDGLQFFRYFFKIREGAKLILNWHHYVTEYVLQAVLDGHISRLVINVGPGYTKTEQAVINFISRGLAINSRAKFIHASYSSNLADVNSSAIRDIVESPEYQDLWPTAIRRDTRGKKRWFTEAGGGMMAASAGGQITGFRAGRMESDTFSGAFVIDDPVKPDDAFSAVTREHINKRFNNTFRSRLAIESVPMIIIMQRIHENDLSGFLLNGGSGEAWHNLRLPALVTKEGLEPLKLEKQGFCKTIDVNQILQNIKNGKTWADKPCVLAQQ